MTAKSDLFALEQAKRREAQRRKQLLGLLAEMDYDWKRLRDHARAIGLPMPTLKKWQQEYRLHGEDGLLPHEWQELDESAQELAFAGYEKLGHLVDVERITQLDIADLAVKLNRSTRSAGRLVDRYRIGGLWGLCPQYNPSKPNRKLTKEPPRDIGTFTESTLETVYERYNTIASMASKPIAAEAEVQALAQEIGIAPRTLRYWLSAYKEYGLAGLAPKENSNKGATYGIGERMVELVRSIRLSHPDWHVRHVHKMACDKAAELGEQAPSKGQVRRIIKSIPAPVLALADKRRDDFRNKYKITYPMTFDGVTYQTDHNVVDLLVKDQRDEGVRNSSGEIRPILTTVLEASSRLIVAWLLSYDHPDRHQVALVIRDSLLAQPGGVPDKIMVDNGKDLVSSHVRELVREMGIELVVCDPYQPQQRGRLERFFGTLNTCLLSSLPGYVDSNVVLRNPSVTARLTIAALAEELAPFVKNYNNEVHSEIGISPADYWAANCFASRVADIRRLDVLLKESDTRKVQKGGINFQNGDYWHPDLATVVKQEVVIRADTRYGAPDEIEVYHAGHWLCTAFEVKSERGLSVQREEIAAAQRLQNHTITTEIKHAKEIIRTVDEAIASNVAHSKQTATTEANNETTVGELAASEAKTQVAHTVTSHAPRVLPARKKPTEDLFDLAFKVMTDQGTEG